MRSSTLIPLALGLAAFASAQDIAPEVDSINASASAAAQVAASLVSDPTQILSAVDSLGSLLPRQDAAITASATAALVAALSGLDLPTLPTLPAVPALPVLTRRQDSAAISASAAAALQAALAGLNLPALPALPTIPALPALTRRQDVAGISADAAATLAAALSGLNLPALPQLPVNPPTLPVLPIARRQAAAGQLAAALQGSLVVTPQLLSVLGLQTGATTAQIVAALAIQAGITLPGAAVSASGAGSASLATRQLGLNASAAAALAAQLQGLGIDASVLASLGLTVDGSVQRRQLGLDASATVALAAQLQGLGIDAPVLASLGLTGTVGAAGAQLAGQAGAAAALSSRQLSISAAAAATLAANLQVLGISANLIAALGLDLGAAQPTIDASAAAQAAAGLTRRQANGSVDIAATLAAQLSLLGLDAGLLAQVGLSISGLLDLVSKLPPVDVAASGAAAASGTIATRQAAVGALDIVAALGAQLSVAGLDASLLASLGLTVDAVAAVVANVAVPDFSTAAAATGSAAISRRQLVAAGNLAGAASIKDLSSIDAAIVAEATAAFNNVIQGAASASGSGSIKTRAITLDAAAQGAAALALPALVDITEPITAAGAAAAQASLASSKRDVTLPPLSVAPGVGPVANEIVSEVQAAAANPASLAGLPAQILDTVAPLASGPVRPPVEKRFQRRRAAHW